MKKLSEMTAAELTTALCELAVPIGNLAQDDEVMEALKQIAEKRKPGTTLGKFFGLSFAVLVPLLLNKHKADTFAVLAALTGKTQQQLAEENGLQLLKEIRGVLTPDIIRFFGLSVGMA